MQIFLETSLEIQIGLEEVVVDEILDRHDVRDDDVAEDILLDVTQAAKNNLLQEYEEGIFAV